MAGQTVSNRTSSAQAVRVTGGKKGEVTYDTLLPKETKENVALDMNSRSNQAKLAAGVLRIDKKKASASSE